MKESWVNPFLNSVIDVWMQEFRLSLQRRRLITSTECLLEGEVSVSFDIGGSIEGIALYEMSTATAKNIAFARSGIVSDEIDEPVLVSLRHVMSAIVRLALKKLDEAGYKCTSTSPRIFQAPGHQFAVGQQSPQVGVVFGSDFGEIQVRVGLKESPVDNSDIDWLLSQSRMTRK